MNLNKKSNLEDANGSGFVEFEVLPLLNSKWFPKVILEYLEKLAKNISNTFYTINDNMAIKIVDRQVSIVSVGE